MGSIGGRRVRRGENLLWWIDWGCTVFSFSFCASGYLSIVDRRSAVRGAAAVVAAVSETEAIDVGASKSESGLLLVESDCFGWD